MKTSSRLFQQISFQDIRAVLQSQATGYMGYNLSINDCNYFDSLMNLKESEGFLRFLGRYVRFGPRILNSHLKSLFLTGNFFQIKIPRITRVVFIFKSQNFDSRHYILLQTSIHFQFKKESKFIWNFVDKDHPLSVMYFLNFL